jgi:hypothetical protein
MPENQAALNRQLLRHAVATVAYRGGKALGGAPDGFAEFRAGEESRTPGEILAHISDVLDWGLTLARGSEKYDVSDSLPWDQASQRFFASLEALDAYLASDAPLVCSPEKLVQAQTRSPTSAKSQCSAAWRANRCAPKTTTWPRSSPGAPAPSKLRRNWNSIKREIGSRSRPPHSEALEQQAKIKRPGARLRDPSPPASSHPSPQGLGKKLLCGVFTVPHEFVSFDCRRHSHFSRVLLAAAQHASQTANAHRPGLSQLVRQGHDDFNRRTAPQSLGQMKVEAARTYFARFCVGFTHDIFVGPADRKRQTHQKTA